MPLHTQLPLWRERNSLSVTDSCRGWSGDPEKLNVLSANVGALVHTASKLGRCRGVPSVLIQARDAAAGPGRVRSGSDRTNPDCADLNWKWRRPEYCLNALGEALARRSEVERLDSRPRPPFQFRGGHHDVGIREDLRLAGAGPGTEGL